MHRVRRRLERVRTQAPRGSTAEQEPERQLVPSGRPSGLLCRSDGIGAAVLP